MRKRFMKGIVCMALSLSMALGTVMVGASEKGIADDLQPKELTNITQISSNIIKKKFENDLCKNRMSK